MTNKTAMQKLESNLNKLYKIKGLGDMLEKLYPAASDNLKTLVNKLENTEMLVMKYGI